MKKIDKKEELKRELRMYTLALYQLSGVQAGIQAGHSWVEYGKDCKDKSFYKEWAKNHKTVMVMNGGSTATMREYIQDLRDMGIDVVEFKEPDLDGLTTAASFILSEKIFDKDYDVCGNVVTEKEMFLRNYVSKFRFHGGR